MDLSKLLPWRRRSSVQEAGGSTSSQQITQSNIQNFVVKAVGQVSDGNSSDFSSPEYSLDEIKNAINADSYIKLAVTKYSQLIFKAGYNIVSTNDSAAEYITTRLRLMSFMTNTPMDILFQQIAEDLVAYSNAFLVKSRLDNTNIGGLQAKGIYDVKPVGGYFRLDPTTVQIKRDKTGTIKQYQQSVGNTDKKYKNTDIIHFYIDKPGGAAFGIPRIQSALEDIKLLRKIEGNTLKQIYRHAQPLIQMKIGIPENGMQATEKEVREAKKEVERLNDDGMIITNERTDFHIIGAENQALDISKYLEYFEKRAFSALFLSLAMVGRGGSKQDADSMEEQVHDAVKYYQQTIATFIENYIFTELLLEGGFNPVMNENDIVRFQFNEISIETRVKRETHVLNKYQGNLISFEEMRKELGLRADNTDINQFYANLIQKTNDLELINAKMNGSSGVSGPDKKSALVNGTGKNTISPQNQNGTSSAKIKESLHFDESSTEANIKKYKKNFPDLYKKYTITCNSICESREKTDIEIAALMSAIASDLENYIILEAQKGYEKACKDTNKTPDADYTLSSKELMRHVRSRLKRFSNDIKKRIKQAADTTEIESVFTTFEYRIRFLTEYIVYKARWYAYAKTCAAVDVTNVYVDFSNNDEARGRKKIINTKKFSLDDIPPFHAYCSCKLNTEGGED